MTDIQTAEGIAQMRKMDFITNTRREKAAIYDRLIKEMKIDFLRPPFVPAGYFHTYQSYVCVMDCGKQRNKIMAALEAQGISTRVGTHANHMLGHYKTRFGTKPEDFPISQMLDETTLTLPLYVQMTEQDQIDVLQAIAKEA
jgi:dTDP-4-amino-4,6-dideoxygalactose transaminase